MGKEKKFSPSKIIEVIREKRPELIVISDSPEIKKRISVQSKKCGHTWDVLYSNLIYHNSGCPVCFSWNLDEYKKRLSVARPRIEVVSTEPEKGSGKIKCRCLDCGREFEANPHSFFYRKSGHGCPKCGHKNGGKKLRLTQAEFEERVAAISPEVEVAGEYMGRTIKIDCKCRVCGYKWSAIPGDVLNNGAGCPRCKMSHGEKCIAAWLEARSIDYIPQYKFDDCVDKVRLPFDFYLPEYNACIEYDGEQHFKPIKYFGGMTHLEITIRHDRIKDVYCDENGVLMWRISYFDEGNIDKELQVYITYCHLHRFVLGGQIV